MGLVNGKDVVLYLGVEIESVLTYNPIACARQISFEMNRDMVETSISGTGQWRTYTIGAISYTGSMEGLVFLKDPVAADNRVAWTTLYAYIASGQPIKIKYYETDNDNNVLIKTCDVIINSLNEISSFDNVSTFTASFTGLGAPDLDWFALSPRLLTEIGDFILTENSDNLTTE